MDTVINTEALTKIYAGDVHAPVVTGYDWVAILPGLLVLGALAALGGHPGHSGLPKSQRLRIEKTGKRGLTAKGN